MTSRKPIIILILGLVCTGLIYTALSLLERKNAKAEFEFETNRIHQQISKQLSSYEEVLIAVKAFFMASKEVSLQEWEIYFDKLDFEKHYPGLQGVGYVHRIKSEEDFNELNAKLQSYGMMNYKIKPEGEREEYFPVVFLDPLDHRNQKAIGYDIYSEETRRNAILSAKNNEATSITRKITLVQEDKKNVQSGLLMMIPFFTNERIDKQDVPREMEGIIDGVIRMDDFINSLLEQEIFMNMQMVIYDQSIDEENIMYDSHKNDQAKTFINRFSDKVVFDVYDQQWLVTFQGQPAANFLPLFFGKKRKMVNMAVLLCGVILSGLSYYLAKSFQTTTRLRAEKVASVMAQKSDQEIIKRQEESLLKFKDDSEFLVVCMIDIENSTLITANLSQKATGDLYSVFDMVMSSIIHSYGGIIVKSMGDAILYYFKTSYPPTSEDYMPAVNCCLEMLDSHKLLNQNLERRHASPINYRISAVYGSVMSATKNDIHDIFGSTVNQCSKINRLAKSNGLVISEEIYSMIGSEPGFKFDKVDQPSRIEYGNGVFHMSRI